MKKLITLCSVVAALAMTDLSAATATQKAAFKAEKKATADSLSATKKAIVALGKAATLEAKAMSLLASLKPESTVKTPSEFIAARSQAGSKKYDAFRAMTAMTDAEIAGARALWAASEKSAAAAEKAAFSALTPAEKVAYKASLAAAIACEAAFYAADVALAKAEYANVSMADRIERNDYEASFEIMFEQQTSAMTPAQVKAAKVALQAMLYSSMGDQYLYNIGLSPEERMSMLAVGAALDPDPATADDIVIADGARYE